MIRRPPRSTLDRSSAASDVYKRQIQARGDRMIVADIRDAEVVADLGTAEGRRAAVAGIRAAAPEGLDGFVACAGLGPNVDPPSRVAQGNYFGAVEVIEGLRDALAARAASVVVISSNSAPMSADAAFVDLLLAGDEEGAAVHVDKCDGQVAYAGSKMGVARWVRGGDKGEVAGGAAPPAAPTAPPPAPTPAAVTTS